MGPKNVARHDPWYDHAVVEGDEEEIAAALGTGDKRPKSPSSYSDKSYETEDSLVESLTTSAGGGASNIVQLCLNKVNILRYIIFITFENKQFYVGVLNILIYNILQHLYLIGTARY